MKEIMQPFVEWQHVGMSLHLVIFLYQDRHMKLKRCKKSFGTPREFTTISVTDGIAMGHEGMKSLLVSREIIADSIEVSMRGHCYDGLVGIAGCDKLTGYNDGNVKIKCAISFIWWIHFTWQI